MVLIQLDEAVVSEVVVAAVGCPHPRVVVVHQVVEGRSRS